MSAILKCIAGHLRLVIGICALLILLSIVLIISQRGKDIKSKAIAAIPLVVSLILGVAGMAAPQSSDVFPVPSESQTSMQPTSDILPTSDSIESPPPTEDTTDTNSDSVEVGTPFVTVSPQDQITNAYLAVWDEENDRDIIGNTYSTAMKLSVSNLIDAIGGGTSDIVAEVHIPLGGKGTGTWIVSFVVAADMVGNGSSADVTILSGDDELYPSFTLDSTTTDEISYEVELADIRDLIFRFDCTSVNSGFCAGIVLEDK